MTEAHDFRDCRDIDCDECQHLIDHDFIMTCDSCDEIGHKDAAGGWLRTDCGITVCSNCEENYI